MIRKRLPRLTTISDCIPSGPGSVDILTVIQNMVEEG
jgi:hypothetical protein